MCWMEVCILVVIICGFCCIIDMSNGDFGGVVGYEFMIYEGNCCCSFYVVFIKDVGVCKNFVVCLGVMVYCFVFEGCWVVVVEYE